MARVTRDLGAASLAVRLAPVFLGLVGLAGAIGWGAAMGHFPGWLLGLGIVSILLLVIGGAWQDSGGLQKRVLSAVYSVFVVLSLAVGYLILANRSTSVDLTADKVHTLSPQSQGFLAAMETEVHAVVFASALEQADLAQFLALYEKASPHFSFSIHDANQDISLARRYSDKITPGDVFLEVTEGGKVARRRHLVLPQGSLRREQLLTNEMIKVVRGQDQKIYFTTGHGEKRTDPTKKRNQGVDESLSNLVAYLAERAMPVDTIDLQRKGRIPEDAAVLVVAGPTIDLFDGERDLLLDYLDSGGALVVMVDPLVTRDGGTMPNLNKVLDRVGIESPNEFVVDAEGNVPGRTPLLPLVEQLVEHPITQALGTAYQMRLDRARPLITTPDADRTLDVKPLLLTGARCWSDDAQRLARTQKTSIPSDNSRIFARIVGAAATYPTRKGTRGELAHAVVFGDSDTFTNGVPSDTAQLLMLQSINWAADRGDLLSIPPRLVTHTPMFLTRGRLWGMIGLFLLVGLGLLFGGTGYTVARRRIA